MVLCPWYPGSSMPDSKEGAHLTLPAITLNPDLLGTNWHASDLSLLLRLQAQVCVCSQSPIWWSGGPMVV